MPKSETDKAVPSAGDQVYDLKNNLHYVASVAGSGTRGWLVLVTHTDELFEVQLDPENTDPNTTGNVWEEVENATRN